MKRFAASLFLLLILVTVRAQFSEGTVAYNKQDRPALKAELNYSPGVVKDVILEDMKYRGFLKSSESKGFRMFPGIIFEQISPEPIDLYLKFDDVKKQKDKTIVYLLMSTGSDNFISGSSYPERFAGARTYLESLAPKFEARQLEINITAQEAVVKKAEKAYNSLIGTGESLQSKKKDLEESIAKNQQAQEAQKAALQKERDLLETLKKQRK